MMRPALLVVIFLGFAGCTSSTPPSGPPLPAPPGGWTLDCSLGAHETGPWYQPCAARASHTPGPKQEIWLAVNPTDADNVVLGSKDNNPESSAKCTWNGLAVTHDGGQTWKDVTIGGRYAARQSADPYYGYACNTDPMLAFHPDGATLHYVVELYNFGGKDGFGPLVDPKTNRGVINPGWKLVLATSHDGGDTWPQATTLLYGDGVGLLNDYSRIAISPVTGTILVAINTFQAFSGYGDVAVPEFKSVCSTIASRDRGKTAERPVETTDRERPGDVPCYGLAVAPDGTFTIGTGGTYGGNQTYFWRSIDDGRSWSEPGPSFKIDPPPARFNESQARTGQSFDLTYDHSHTPRRGTLYVIYADDARGDSDMFVRASRDHGRTWGDPAQVNDDNSTHHQWLGNAVVADDGFVHAVFFDKRWDPDNRLIDVTHAISADGGATWFNERVTNVSFDGDLGVHQENFPFIGDYLGIGASGGVVWLGFPDASLGTTVIAAARSVQRA